MTGDMWVGVMEAVSNDQNGAVVYVYFSSFLLIISIILLNLMTAIVIGLQHSTAQSNRMK